MLTGKVPAFVVVGTAAAVVVVVVAAIEPAGNIAVAAECIL